MTIITRLMAERAAKLDLTADRVLQEIRCIAFSASVRSAHLDEVWVGAEDDRCGYLRECRIVEPTLKPGASVAVPWLDPQYILPRARKSPTRSFDQRIQEALSGPPVVRKNSIGLPSDRHAGTYLFGFPGLGRPNNQSGEQKMLLSRADPVQS